MLEKIKTVPLRKIWKNEAQDFTPWLSKNLDKIGEAIGLELEFEDSEVPVGPYAADILAKDAGNGSYVVIENQLEKTDHDHLGKCLTYASVLDATTVIWIASRFTEEHKKALDWLNDHTSEEIGFYGIKVELWQIDNSQPAVKFNVISAPNVTVKQATRRKEQGELTEARRTQLDFWSAFKNELVKTGKINSLQTPRPQYWFDIALGKSGVHLSNTFNTDRSEIGLRVYIGSKKAEEWLPYFESRKQEIESIIGSELVWNPNPDNRDKVITLTKHFELTDKDNWKAAIAWLVEYTIIFRKTFSKMIKEKTM